MTLGYFSESHLKNAGTPMVAAVGSLGSLAVTVVAKEFLLSQN